jgi:hypothetical protein
LFFQSYLAFLRLLNWNISISFIPPNNIVTWLWLQTGFGLVIGFIGHLQNITTNNYGSVTELHTPNIAVTTVHLNFSVFTSRCLVAASNGERSPSSRFPICPRASVTSFSLITTATLN